MKEVLVAYFSASGNTEKVAERVSALSSGTLFEIKPTVPYVKADLNWMNKKSRSTIEMKDKTSRPEIAEKVENFEKYNTILIGFPIWWYTAPRIIQTFLESYDFSNKTIALFATSGGSGLGDTINDLKPSVSDSAVFSKSKMLNRASDNEIKEWLSEII